MNLSPYFVALIILTGLSIHSQGQDVYKYEDENGNIIYSDTPPANQENLAPAELPDIIMQPAVEVTERSSDNRNDAADISVSIVSPDNEANILNDESAVGVFASASRQLKNGETAVLLVNGNEHSESRSLSWSVTDLVRGEMRLTVIIRDSNDRVLASSENISIFVHRPSIGPVRLPVQPR